MPRKYNTIIFVPHARARFRRLRISNLLLGTAGSAILLLLAVAILFAVTFFTSARRDREYRRALAENVRLRVTGERLEDRVSSLSRKLDEFEERTRRLAIVAGLSNLSDSGRGGVGGAAPSGTVDLGGLTDRSRSLESRLGQIEERLARQNQELSSTPTVRPVRGLITSGFGARSDPFDGGPSSHVGIDISTQRGNPVLAPADGVVVRTDWVGGYGRALEIAHGFGYRTLFGHLDEIRVKEGQRVRRGEVIGEVGSTGRSTGPHLHYEVWVDNHAVNPLQYILDWN